MALTAAAPQPQRVLCYGDSLTAGTSPPLEELYPYAPTLEQAVGPAAAMVRHRGLPGATAAMMLQCADDDQRGLRALLQKASPALSIILAGTNDLGFESTSDPIVRSVIGLHEIAHALNVHTIAVGIPPSAYQHTQSEAAELCSLVNRELRAWCLERSEVCSYVDHPIRDWAPADPRWAPDGLHFSPEGYRTVGMELAGIVNERLAIRKGS